MSKKFADNIERWGPNGKGYRLLADGSGTVWHPSKRSLKETLEAFRRDLDNFDRRLVLMGEIIDLATRKRK